MTDPATAYARSVLSGEIAAGEPVRLACQRHIDDLAAEEFRWDVSELTRVLAFCSQLRHWKGEFAGKPFLPEPWQAFILGSIFGWKRPDGTRRFRVAYVEIPRKNGKSFLAAAIGLYGLLFDREEGAEIYSVATKRDQAKIVWRDACQIRQRSATLSKLLRQRYSHLETIDRSCRFEPLASDSKTLDGLNPHMAINDELHVWPDRGLYDVIEDGMGARRQPLIFSITTAGWDQFGICFEMRSFSLDVLAGRSPNPAHFAYIATLDPEDVEAIKSDPQKLLGDRNLWAKANPNLGVSKKEAYLEEQIRKAIQVPSKFNQVLNKQFDCWTDSELGWLDMAKWVKGAKPIDPEKLACARCWVGLDLSSSIDVTAAVAVFPPGPYPEWTVTARLYLPEDNLRERGRKDRVPYLDWREAGWITTTPGNVIDLEFIKADLLDFASKHELQDVGFDPWKAIEISTSLEQAGLSMVQMRQGHATLGAPTAMLEKLVLSEQIRHGGNPVLTWMASNAVVIRDSNDNIKPDKAKARNRIDGIVALVMALGRAQTAADEKPSVYESRGLIIL